MKKFMSCLKKAFEKHRFLCFLVLNTMLVSVCISRLPWLYETNDDAGMVLIASGKTLGQPDGHLAFINYCYGYFLSLLYGISSAVEWYTLLLVVSHILSLSIISNIILKAQENQWVRVLSLVLLYFLELRILVLLEFTTTAGLLATAGLLQVLDDSKGNKRWRWIGVVLFVLASMVRFHSAMLAGAIVAFLYPFVVIVKGLSRVRFLGLVVCAILAVGFRFADRMAYLKDSQWSEFYHYNKVRGKINDNWNAFNIYDHLPDGICRADYELLLSFFQSSDIFDTETLSQCLESIEKHTSFSMKLRNIPPQFMVQKFTFLSLIVMTLVMEVCCSNSKQRLALLFAFLAFLGIACYIPINGTLKLRALLCAIFPYLFLMVATIKIEEKRAVLYAIPVLMFSLLMVNKLSKIKIDEQAEVDYKGIVNELQLEDVIFVNCAASPAFVSPWHITRDYVPSIPYGWSLRMPGIKMEYNQFVDDPTMAILTSKGRFETLAGLIKESIKFHHNMDVSPLIICEKGDYVAFRYESENQEN